MMFCTLVLSEMERKGMKGGENHACTHTEYIRPDMPRISMFPPKELKLTTPLYFKGSSRGQYSSASSVFTQGRDAVHAVEGHR